MFRVSTRRFVGSFALLLACRSHDDAAAQGSETGTGTSTGGSESGVADTTGGEPLPPRPDVIACRFDGLAPGLLPPVAFEPALDDAAIVDLAQAPDGGRTYVARVDLSLDVLDAAGVPQPALDLTARASRVVAIALPADHADSGDVYVRFESKNLPERGVISRFRADLDTGVIDPVSEHVVLELAGSVGDRSGGALVFGPDDMLYIGVGDPGDDIDAVAQDLGDRRGKLLRLDVRTLDATGTYAIPPDNPHVGEGGHAGEVWARGLRDPWRCVFDPGDPKPYCADVGAEQSEIDHIDAASNLGWPWFDGGTCLLPGGDCGELSTLPPSASYRSVDGDCGIAGVVVARDAEFPDLDGALIYADRCSGRVRGLDTDSQEVLIQDEILGVTASLPSAIARDDAGRIYLLGGEATERVIVPADPAVFPTMLSDSGCFDDLRALTPTVGVVPYDINAPLWTDGAVKQRYVVLPPGQQIEVDDAGFFGFPIGTLLIKNFAFDFDAADPATRRSVETRVMVRREFGWQFHSYRWNDDGSDATLLDGAATTMLSVVTDGVANEFEYAWPSRASCKVCHGLGASNALGPRIDQLDRIHDYGHVQADQLAAWRDIGMFEAAVPELTPIASPDDAEAPLEQRARAYLHGNCGHCHRPGGWTPAALTMDLRYTTPLADTHTCNVMTQYYNAWVDSVVRIVPGDPEGSVIWQRLHRRGLGQMPPLATAVPDPHAQVVHDWIASLAACP